MSYYEDVYRKRLNRYGEDFKSRVQGQREKGFEDYLNKSVYRIDFEYKFENIPAILEPYKQDQTQTLGYLLTRLSDKFPAGFIVNVGDKKWMIWWLDENEARGYNRYVVLKLNKQITWQYNKKSYEQWGYFEGAGKKVIRDVAKSGANTALFMQNDNLNMFITPASKNFTKTTYMEITTNGITDAFQVKGIDLHSTEGIGYISLDPVLKRSKEQLSDNPKDDWLNGEVK